MKLFAEKTFQVPFITFGDRFQTVTVNHNYRRILTTLMRITQLGSNAT